MRAAASVGTWKYRADSITPPNVAAFVAYSQDRPVSCSMAIASHGVAWGGEGATIAAARGQGLAHEVHLLQHAGGDRVNRCGRHEVEAAGGAELRFPGDFAATAGAEHGRKLPYSPSESSRKTHGVSREGLH